MIYLSGRIDEFRGRFIGDEASGDVRFGRRVEPPSGGRPTWPIRVTLDDGREAYGRYSDPENVRLRLRVRQTKRKAMRYHL